MAAIASGRTNGRKALPGDESKRKLPKIIPLNDCRDPIKMSKGAVLWLAPLVLVVRGPPIVPATHLIVIQANAGIQLHFASAQSWTPDFRRGDE
jgi:hypothetical protein